MSDAMRFTVYFDGTGNGLSNTDTHLEKNLEIGKNVDSTTHLGGHERIPRYPPSDQRTA